MFCTHIFVWIFYAKNVALHTLIFYIDILLKAVDLCIIYTNACASLCIHICMFVLL